jgi:hypothetical protein
MKKKMNSLRKVDKMEEQEMGVTGGWATLKNVLWRILAVFAASGLSVLGAGAVVGIDLLSAVFMAGILGVATVVERLARAFLDDGKLTLDEINAAFAKVDKNQE